MDYLKKRFSVAPGRSRAYRDHYDEIFGKHAREEVEPPSPDEVIDPDPTPTDRPPMPPPRTPLVPEPTPMPPAEDDED